MAFSCSYSRLLDQPGPCGLSGDYPGQVECVPLKDCTKDVTGHLTTLKLSSDDGIATEMKLLLARAGKPKPLCHCYDFICIVHLGPHLK